MLRTAPFLALQAFTLSILFVAPAAAQTREAAPREEGPRAAAPNIPSTACVQRTSLEARTRPERNDERRMTVHTACNTMREGTLAGGWLGHAIILLDPTLRPLLEAPRPATGWASAAPPAFSLPVARQ